MTNLAAKSLLFAAIAVATDARAHDMVTTLAGQPLVIGIANGFGTNALFNDPAGMVADSAGNLYVADSQNHAIRKIGVNGLVSTFAGQPGTPGSNNGTGTQARFNTPSGIAIDQSGILFVSDTGNHTIRKIIPQGGSGNVTTLAGFAGQSGFINGIGTTARFNSPLGIDVSANGVIYVADCGNHLIRAISAAGAVTTLAGLAETWGSKDGTGSNARFNGPVGLALDTHGNLFVSDANNHTIRNITPAGVVTTWAGIAGVDGYQDGARLSAKFAQPAELAFDAHGNMVVADSFNHVIRIISTDGIVSTVTGLAGDRGSTDGVNGQGRLFNPYGLAFSPGGALMVADAYNELIRVALVPFSVQLQMSSDGSSATISWPSEVGRKYQVQYRGGLDASTWSNLGTVITANSLVTSQTADVESPGQAMMFRVLVVQ